MGGAALPEQDPLELLRRSAPQAAAVLESADPLGMLRQTAARQAVPTSATTLPAVGMPEPQPQGQSLLGKALSIGELIVDEFRTIGDAIEVAFGGPAPAGPGRRALQAKGLLAPITAADVQTDPTQPIVTPEYIETNAEFFVRRAAEGDPAAQEKLRRVQRGTAFIASILPSAAFARLARIKAGALAPTLMRRVLGRTGAFLTGEALSGATYGTFRPLEEGESRGAAMARDAATFAVIGGSMRGVWRAGRRAISVLPRARRIAIARRAAQVAREHADAIRAGGGDPAILPPHEKQAIQTMAFRQAVEELEPNAIDFDAAALVREQLEIEPTPRFTDDIVNLDDLVGPGPREINFPSELLIEKTPEFMAPPRVEPVGVAGLTRPADDVVNALRKAPDAASQEQVIADAAQEAIRDMSRRLGRPVGVSNIVDDAIPVQALEPQAVTPPATRKLTLVVALRDSKTGKVHYGEPGEIHAELGDRIKGSEGFDSGFAEPGKKFLTPEDAFARLPHDLQRPGQAGFLVGEELRRLQDALPSGPSRTTDPVGLEPQAVTPGVAPPRGFRPTALAISSRDDIVTGAPSEVRTLTLADEAIEDAIARMEPVAVMDNRTSVTADALRTAADAAREFAPAPMHEQPALRRAIEDALERGTPEADQQVLMELTGTSMRVLDLEAKVPRAQRAEARKALDRAFPDTPERAPIEVGDLADTPAIGPEVAAEAVVTPPLAGWQVLSRMTDEQFETFTRAAAEPPVRPPRPSEGVAGEIVAPGGAPSLERLPGTTAGFSAVGAPTPPAPPKGSFWEQVFPSARGERGAIDAALQAQIATSGASAGSFLTAEFIEERNPDAAKVLRAVGLVFAAAAASPVAAKWLKPMAGPPGSKRLGLFRKMVRAMDHETMLMKPEREASEEARAVLTQWQTEGHFVRDDLRTIFDTDAARTNLSHVVDEGAAAPEFAMLSPAQQQEALGQRRLMFHMGRWLNQLGLLDRVRSAYVRQVVPAETLAAWRQMSRRKYPTLREATTFAQARNLPLPDADGTFLQSAFMVESGRAMAFKSVHDSLWRLGAVDLLKNYRGSLPAGWRPVRAHSPLGRMVARDDIATVLENFGGRIDSESKVSRFLDGYKAIWMNAINVTNFDHALNLVRSAMVAAWHPFGIVRYMSAVAKADPVVRRASAAGVQLFQRPDLAQRGERAIEGAIKAIGAAAPALKPAAQGGLYMWQWMNKALWERLVPSVGLLTFQKEMMQFTRRSGGRILPGSPAYREAERRAANVANTMMGKLPDVLQSKGAALAMRQAFFAPSWMRTRLAMTAHAGRDLHAVLAGQLDPRDATYLKYKMRQVLLGVGITYTLSKLFTGEEPQFNEASAKYYAKTGIRDETGRELGLDMLGWWQDDLKLGNDPFKYAWDRGNPAFKVTAAIVQGRDNFGRAIEGAERLERVIESLGPPGKAVQAVADAVATGEMPMHDVLRVVTDVAQIGNVSALPRPMDVAISQMARRLLRRTGVPENSDNIFQLSRIMSSNVMAGGAIVDGRVTTFLAITKRGQQRRGPIASLWTTTREVLFDMIR